MAAACPVEIELTSQVYRAILERNTQLISQLLDDRKGKKRSNVSGSANLFSDLRLCVGHPFATRAVQDIETADAGLVDASAKMSLLQTMLPKLIARGHRCLIFCT